MSPKTFFVFLTLLIFPLNLVLAEDGSELWLRYRKEENLSRLAQYQGAVGDVAVLGSGPSVDAVRAELKVALSAILGKEISVGSACPSGNGLVIGTKESLTAAGLTASLPDFSKLGEEGYVLQTVRQGEHQYLVAGGNSAVSLLYGTFDLLRRMQASDDISNLKTVSVPKIAHRYLNHWDNINGSVERGYAGRSLWNWQELPKTNSRYRDYARACASVGINGTVLNNVNSQVESLTQDYLVKTAALADVFRPYGIRVMLTARFNAPMALGGLKTADPRDPEVIAWWEKKTNEIYNLIPDFGGFLIKASSEGQPGPQTYKATHADGANMLGKILAPHGGLVMWRAFVYDMKIDKDRAKCAYKEFAPLDGQFLENVVVQVKNGPIDFQPREPFHPLFGAMPKTLLGMELQITKEYLGQSKHLVYLAPMWKEVLDSDTFANGTGSTVAKVIDGTLDKHRTSVIAGVANVGNGPNWCGHPFDQANWYAFGRLAWDHDLTSEQIAEEWIRCTWTHDPQTVRTIRELMCSSRETCVNYMVPLGLAHIMVTGNHYGPQPGLNAGNGSSVTPQYYHRAGPDGIGFDRSSKGSNAVAEYHAPLCDQWENVKTCPDQYLLWFHHVPWNFQMSNGHTVWEELQRRYDLGVSDCEKMEATWQSLESKIDAQRFLVVSNKLKEQSANAKIWRKTCLDVFQASMSGEKTP